MDQAGHYYFQAKGDSQPVMTVMSALPQQAASEEGEEFIINHENDESEPSDEHEEVSTKLSSSGKLYTDNFDMLIKN